MAKLIISEKDNAAKRIAHILSGGKVTTGKSFGVPIYTFQDKEGEECSVIGLKGHILKVDFPEDYSNWQKVKPIELVDAKIVKIPSQKSIIKALQKQAKSAKEIIVATDFDREGELIGVDAVNKTKEVNSKATIKRARFSALTEDEIKRAFDNLEEIYANLAKAGEARQDIDLIWGATLTRFISLASKRLGKQFLSAGRVQSPTLAILVDREKERKSFISKPYWQIKALLKAEQDEQEFIAQHKTDKFWDKKEADEIVSNLGKKGVVICSKRTKKSISPPAPFNTTSLLATASSLGVSASYAMRIAEGLYMDGLISYPRVDNTVYPPSLNLKEILVNLKKSKQLGGLAAQILAQDKIVPTRGKKKTTDHPPIHPTGVANEEDLKPQEWKIYQLVVRRFLATLAPPASMESARIDISIECPALKHSEPFFLQGSRIVDEGWLKFYSYGRKKDEDIPHLSEGDTVLVKKPILESKETQPSQRYGQGRLIQEMEKLGLGTKSTRHSIIQGLYNRGYVHSDPIIPTEVGIAVTDTLKKNAEAITNPALTAQLEKDMDLIADGKVERGSIVDASRGVLRAIVKVLEEKEAEIGEGIRNGIRKSRIIGKCPCSKGELRIIKSKKTGKRFVGCSSYPDPDCKTTYPLPQFGTIISLGETC
ncbi:DNA topoisomerase I, partial [Candidatus Oleimmundimicrobium sp.]|uniref:DNA topoisomerase I n=1 Tax=Candidatus Oleimmundimicrobium sp. TaxID=3060597 RepID=UPI00272231FD